MKKTKEQNVRNANAIEHDEAGQTLSEQMLNETLNMILEKYASDGVNREDKLDCCGAAYDKGYMEGHRQGLEDGYDVGYDDGYGTYNNHAAGYRKKFGDVA
jgi:flagellar biosynthesis/type III secretory pathway protein FliH